MTNGKALDLSSLSNDWVTTEGKSAYLARLSGAKVLKYPPKKYLSKKLGRTGNVRARVVGFCRN